MADTYRIILQPEAYEGMESGYAYMERDAPEGDRQWAVGLMGAINSLETFPARCSLAPEEWILFTIADAAVSILHIRHSAQDTLKP